MIKKCIFILVYCRKTNTFVKFLLTLAAYSLIRKVFKIQKTNKIKYIIMKITTKLLFLLLFTATFLKMQAQRITFAYDAAGNRTARTIVMQPRVNTLEAPNEEFNPFVEQAENHVITIFPNPTRGMLIIEISSIGNNERFRAILYNQQGRLMQDVESFTGTALNMDLSAYPPGVYILQLRIGDKTKEYRIIKQ